MGDGKIKYDKVTLDDDGVKVVYERWWIQLVPGLWFMIKQEKVQ